MLQATHSFPYTEQVGRKDGRFWTLWTPGKEQNGPFDGGLCRYTDPYETERFDREAVEL